MDERFFAALTHPEQVHVTAVDASSAIEAFELAVSSLGLDSELVTVVGGAALAARGLRATPSLDLIVMLPTFRILQDEAFKPRGWRRFDEAEAFMSGLSDPRLGSSTLVFMPTKSMIAKLGGELSVSITPPWNDKIHPRSWSVLRARSQRLGDLRYVTLEELRRRTEALLASESWTAQQAQDVILIRKALDAARLGEIAAAAN